MSTELREYLCALEELEATGAVGIARDNDPHEIVVVCSNGAPLAYVNSCPHKGTPLEMFPDKFLDETGTQLICTTHGARFNTSDGICTFGPCLGERLRPLSITIIDGHVYFEPRQQAKNKTEE